MSANSVLSQIKSRRTTRTYLERPVPEELVDTVLDAALSAPSAHNCQPWVFYVVRGRGVRSRLIQQMVSAWERAMELDGRPKELIEQTKAKFTARFSAAPVLIVACVDHRALYYDRYADEERKRFEALLGHHSLAAAIENLLLAAHALGLGACWYSAPLFCQQSVRAALGIGEWLEPAALITLGYPATGGRKQKSMKRFEEVVVKLD